MAIKLHVEPQTPAMTWQEFCQKTKPFSIALDGYVKDGPITTDRSPRLNLNHHEGVDRLATRATCAQVLMLIKNGLFNIFCTPEGEPCADVYVIDCDQDVCTSDFLLRHGYMVRYARNRLLSRLVDMEDRLDTTTGGYPYRTDLPALRQLAWVFEPYTSFRLNGGLDRRVAAEYEAVIKQVGKRIMKHIKGKGYSLKLDTRYKVIGGGKGWSLIQEIGPQAFNGAARDGITAFVSVRERADSKFNYTFWRSLPFDLFDIPGIIAHLNKIEGCTTDCWGCGNNNGGSPRIGGSSLLPNQLEQIIKALLKQR